MKRSVKQANRKAYQERCYNDVGGAAPLNVRNMAATFQALVAAFCSLYDRGLFSRVFEWISTL